MPRISTKDNTTTEPKRAPRRQVARRAVATRVRKTPTTEVVEKRTEEDRPLRKAPTNVDVPRAKVKFSRKVIVFSGVFVAVLAIAVWIGTADSGQINVASKIEERNTQIANGEFTADNSSGVNGGQIVPVQNTAPTVPNGGLKGRGVGTPPVGSQQAAVANTDNVATTTETTNSTSSETTVEENSAPEQNNETTNSENDGNETNDAVSEEQAQSE